MAKGGQMHWGTLNEVEDTLICDVPVVEWHYDEDGNEPKRPDEPYPCGAEVYVTWSFTVPVVRGEPTFAEDVGKEAVSGSWEMACTNGHTHAVSSNQITADDYPEQFDPTVVGP